MKNQWLAAAAFASSLMVAPLAWAVPTATLSFQTPSAIVGPTDAIPVFLTLTLDFGSDTGLTTDSSGNVTSGFSSEDLPEGFAVSRSNLNVSFLCSGTFTDICTNGPPYKFSFNTVSSDKFYYASNLDLQPGNSQTFLFGTFTPSNGPVAAGEYYYSGTEFFIQVYDENQANPDQGPDFGKTPWQYDIKIANSSECGEADCGFRRTVSAVPEPETYAMMLAGLGLMGWLVRRRARG